MYNEVDNYVFLSDFTEDNFGRPLLKLEI